MMKPVQQQLDDIRGYLKLLMSKTEGQYIKEQNTIIEYLPDLIENAVILVNNLQSDIAYQDFLKLCGVNESEINSY